MVSIMIKSSSPQFNREMHGAKEEKTNRWSDGANAHAHVHARWHTRSQWSPHSCAVSDLLELFLFEEVCG